ncbi:cytochrome c oxidase subunit 5B, mitochondrial [Tetranychus urticae]|uniref:Cytochrome c oxidase subunit 5B, mitochondrial n=1 Tax=Tetranychus urticae TaxID=32264 RepID=T1L3Q8_TETUR|nr:cytochrome c oxidase subunit 5B, mitochondrial [Tetranychus urticae]
MSLLRRGAILANRVAPMIQSRRGLELSKLPVLGFLFDKRPVGLPDPIEAAIGNTKMELMLEEMGVTDPFLENPIYLNGGSKEDPMMVLMLTDKRMIGCQCEPDQTYFNYMWVHKDECKRCECGYWFKGVEIPNPQLYVVDKAFT